MLHKFDLTSAIIGMMIAIAVSVVVVNIKYEGYRQVHQTNIGGIIIEGKHIYELVELQDPSQGVVRK